MGKDGKMTAARSTNQGLREDNLTAWFTARECKGLVTMVNGACTCLVVPLPILRHHTS